MATPEQLLIEGFRPDELPEALGPELEAEVVNGRPMVARVGTAEVLISLAIDGGLLRAELAHVDGGGEGVLPALISVVVRLAQRRGAADIEWLVFATKCARPNPRLRSILERRGFVVRVLPDRGLCYHRRDRVASGGIARTDRRAEETMLKNEVPILDSAVLTSMPTPQLLGRLRRLRRCEDSASLSDASPEELVRVTGILFKDTPEWKTAYIQLKQVLAGREHVMKGAEARALRLERVRMSRTAEHRRRR